MISVVSPFPSPTRNSQLGVAIYMFTQIIYIPIYSSPKINNLTPPPPPTLQYRRRKIKYFRHKIIMPQGDLLYFSPSKNCTDNFNFRKQFSSEVRCNPGLLCFICCAQQFLTTTMPNTL